MQAGIVEQTCFRRRKEYVAPGGSGELEQEISKLKRLVAKPVINRCSCGASHLEGQWEVETAGNPTMKDRSMQALYLLALLPAAETTADPNFYGFRPKRSTADPIE